MVICVWLLKLHNSFPCIVHKDDTLWADEVNQKNADAMSTDDDLGDDAVYYVNSDFKSNIDELVGLESDSDKFGGF